MDDTGGKLSRLDFLKALAAGTALIGAPFRTAAAPKRAGESMAGLAFPRAERPRVGVIGVGGRGSSLLSLLLATDHVDLVAVCDIIPEKVRRAQDEVKADGQPEPRGFSAGDRDYRNMLDRVPMDIAVIATPWRWHVPMCLDALERGVAAATEVPAATTLDDCWRLVDASEKSRRHCVILENCCYGQTEMMALNMVRDGLFGDLTHAEAAYIHDLRDELFSDQGEGLWRRFEHTQRNGNLYPTHGLGPVARYLNIHRGDRFTSLVSMSSRERGLSEWRDTRTPPDSPKRKERYVCGDINTSLIRTALGRTVMLQHDTVTPRPYSRINMVCGVKGAFRDYPAGVFVDGSGHGGWQDAEGWRERYDHPLWKRVGELARKLGGHGGMDFLMAYRLVEAMRNGEAPDMDVYDAAAWSAPGPLSEASVRRGGAPVDFPDFTRGGWKTADA